MHSPQAGKTETSWLTLLGAGRDQVGGTGGTSGVGGLGGAMIRLAHLAEAAHQYQAVMGSAEAAETTDQLRVQGWTPRHVDTAPPRGSARRESSR